VRILNPQTAHFWTNIFSTRNTFSESLKFRGLGVSCHPLSPTKTPLTWMSDWPGWLFSLMSVSAVKRGDVTDRSTAGPSGLDQIRLTVVTIPCLHQTSAPLHLLARGRHAWRRGRPPHAAAVLVLDNRSAVMWNLPHYVKKRSKKFLKTLKRNRNIFKKRFETLKKR